MENFIKFGFSNSNNTTIICPCLKYGNCEKHSREDFRDHLYVNDIGECCVSSGCDIFINDAFKCVGMRHKFSLYWPSVTSIEFSWISQGWTHGFWLTVNFQHEHAIDIHNGKKIISLQAYATVKWIRICNMINYMRQQGTGKKWFFCKYSNFKSP